jgi:hypothetical protein
MTPPNQGPPDPVPPGPAPLNQTALSPDRLGQLLDGAVQTVTARAGTFDRIQHGVRRRRAVRRASAVLLGIAMIAGGGVTALAMAPTGATARLGAVAAVPATSAADVGTVPANAAQGRSLSPAISANGQAGAKAQAGANVHSAASAASPSAGVPAPSAADLGPRSQPDVAVIKALGDAGTTPRFLLVVQTAASGTQNVTFTATSVQDTPEVIGSADAAGNGLPEIFVLLDKGCCRQLWTIFRLVNGHLTQVTMAGKPVELAVGGTVADSAGFSCGGSAHDLVTYGYRNESAGKFLATRATYRWAGARLVLVSRQQATIQAAAPSAQLARYTGVSCGDLPQYAA